MGKISSGSKGHSSVKARPVHGPIAIYFFQPHERSRLKIFNGEHWRRDDLEVAEPVSSRHAPGQPASLHDLHRCLDRFDRVAAFGHEGAPGRLFAMLFCLLFTGVCPLWYHLLLLRMFSGFISPAVPETSPDIIFKII